MTIIKISDYIATILSKDIYHNKDDIEVISYGLQGYISTFLNSLLSFLIALGMNLMYEYILFNIIFIPIRMKHKGYHCKTFIGCVINSNIMILIATLFIHHIEINIVLMTILFSINIILHYVFSIEKRLRFTFVIYSLYLLSLYIDLKISYCFFVVIMFNTILIKGRKLYEKNIE